VIPAIAARIPLVRRPKPPGIPLADRMAALTELTIQPAGASHQQLVARASGILNFAALIASDAGLPDLASDLCWRQHAVFAQATCLDQDVAVMALMPVVNIARLLIRQGDGERAFDVLQRLYRAAQLRSSTLIGNHAIDMAPLIRTGEDHRKICTELWTTVLTDGARALARAGQWTEAARTMTAHRGIGNRLLDGRQIKIMSLTEQRLPDQARAMIDSSTPAEPWENTVAALLRICCQPETSASSRDQPGDAASQALDLITQSAEPTTAVFRVRIGLTALDLAASQPVRCIGDLQAAVLSTALSDAYAARDVLASPAMRTHLTGRQQHQLTAILTNAALGTRNLPPHHLTTLTTVARQGEHQLAALLKH
jgi:hypothetical protein